MVSFNLHVKYPHKKYKFLLNPCRSSHTLVHLFSLRKWQTKNFLIKFVQTANINFLASFWPFNCRLFGSSGACSACAQTIPANEFVMRTTSHLNGPNAPANTNTSNGNPQSIQHHVFHLKCFSCSKCGSHLVQGDR